MDCLECGAALVLAPDVQVGDRVTCPACGEVFEVVEVEPFEIDYPDEDWDDWADEDWDLDEDAPDEDDEPGAG